MKRLAAIVLFASGGLPVHAAAQGFEADGTPENRVGAAPALTAENVAAFFDAAFNVQRMDHQMVGAVVSVVYGGEVLFQRGYGWADLEERLPADPQRSLFRIASITKPFVWTAVMQLVEQGRLDLDADVNQYLDFEIPSTFTEPIRLRHLLSHTPGFEERGRDGLARTPDELRGLGEELGVLMPARVRPPGEHASYSNYGAALAGYIVQRTSGQPWAEYIEEHILRPLEMSSTNARTVMSPELKGRHAKGYQFQAGQFVPTDFWYSRLSPAGHMSSTAGDMASFMLMHLNLGVLGETRILEESTARLMQSPLFAPHPDLPPILHGFYRSDRNGQVVFGHGGDTNQFHSNMSLLPGQGLGIFVSFNTDPSSAARSNLIPAFLDRFFPAEYLRRPPEPSELDLSEYAGEYIPLRSNFSTLERLRTISSGQTIRVRDGELLFGNARWVSIGPNRFTGRYTDQTVIFERNQKGEVTHLIMGSPLSTLRRVRGLEAPRNIGFLLALSISISLAAVLGWGYRAFRQVPEEERLPKYHVVIGWLHALLLGGLLWGVLAGIGSLAYGIPVWTHILLVAFNANLGLGLLVVAFSVQQWAEGRGTVWARSRYAFVALATVFNFWFGWAFHLVGYALW